MARRDVAASRYIENRQFAQVAGKMLSAAGVLGRARLQNGVQTAGQIIIPWSSQKIRW